jgi:putative aldouronate transport system substrate-binding protein
MKNFRRILTLILVFAFTFGMFACNTGSPEKRSDAGADSASTGTATAAPNDLYKVDIFTMLGNYSGIQTGWFAKVVRDRFNMELNMIASNVDGGTDVKFATLLASGTLGDIIIFGNSDAKYLDSISGGFLLDMTRDGLLDKYGKDIVNGFPKVIEKAKVQFGNGTGVYGLGYYAANVNGGASESEDMTWGPDLRWDLYERLGRPAIKTMEDYLPVLQQMKMLEPRSESGRPTYGFSLWADWDTDKMCLAKQYANVCGYDETDRFNSTGWCLSSADEDKYQALLDPDSYYIKCLKLYFNANQMGLMDPDSISQKFEDVTAKYKDGQVLFSWFPWMDSIYNTPERQAEGKGFKLVPFEDERIYSLGFNPYGDNRLISIGAGVEHPERIMEFINWIYTPEGFATYKYGPRGLGWDLKDGKPYLTEFGLKAIPTNGPEPVPAEYGGGNWRDGNSQMNIDPIHPTSVNPMTGEPYDFHLWTSYLQRNPTKLVQSWRAAMGVLTSKEYFVKNNKIAVCDPVFIGKAPDIMDKSMEQKRGQISTIIRQYSWKAIFARDPAEFDSLLKEMTAKARGLGYDEVVQWQIDRSKQVLEARKKQ